MNGADYIAKTRLSTRDDQTLALPGDTCDRVPPDSLPWLLASGHIEPAATRAEQEN